MAIVDGELIEFKSAAVNDSGTNGGRMDDTAPISQGVKNNLWPDVSPDERAAGSVKYRKTFQAVRNAANTAFQNVRIWLSSITGGADRVHMIIGTQRDTQSAIPGSPTLYGAGELDADVTAGANTLDVLTEAGADVIFRAGEEVWISDGTNSEFLTIAGGGVSYTGDVATITFTGNITDSYAAATPTVVASVYNAGNVSATVDNYAESTASGTFDEVGNPVTPHGTGTIEQTWTVTFSSATAFTVVGDEVGSVGSGNISTPFAPNNPESGTPYFTIPTAAWGGTWAAAETLVFQTHPAAVPTWLRRTLPAASGPLGTNDYGIKVRGESA